MVDVETLAGKVFALLKGNGLKIKIFDETGNETTDPNAGRRFFVLSPNIMVTIDTDGNTVEFNKGASVGDEANSLQKGIKKLADEFLMNSTIKVFGKTIQPRDYAYQAKVKKGEEMMEGSVINPINHQLLGEVLKKLKYFKQAYDYTIADDLGVGLEDVRPILNVLVKDGKVKAEREPRGTISYSISMEEAITESFSKMFGTQKTSRQTLENVKILVKHKTPVDENVRGSRSRHISSIFLECNGERFRFPYNYLPAARAMAQHLAHGGSFGDKVGGYITESTGQLMKLQSFNRYVINNNLINEDSSGIVETVKENIETLRTELKKLSGSKTYETVRARLESFEKQPLQEGDIGDLKELFTIRRFDEKFEEVLPIVKQLIQEKDTYHKRIEEAANSIVYVREETIDTSPLLEFTSENAKLGYKINQISTRIVENDELAGFVGKVGNKVSKNVELNEFEKVIVSKVLENLVLESKKEKKQPKDIKESLEIESFFDRYEYLVFRSDRD